MFLKKCGLALLVAGLAFIGFAGNAQAYLIVGDDFSGGIDGASITGRAPNLANLPGATWILPSTVPLVEIPYSFTISTAAGYGNPAPGAVHVETQVCSAISLASSGSYVKPTSFTISADLSPNTIQGPASDGRGLALGFYSGIGAGYSQNLFTGLVLDAAGNLNLVQDPNSSGFFGAGSYRGTQVAFVGTWDASAYHTLSYTVDTTTGNISNISLSGSTADYSGITSTLFTDAATLYAGMYVSGTNALAWTRLDNFAVTVVPEPSTLMLLGAGLLGLLAYAWRKKK